MTSFRHRSTFSKSPGNLDQLHKGKILQFDFLKASTDYKTEKNLYRLYLTHGIAFITTDV